MAVTRTRPSREATRLQRRSAATLAWGLGALVAVQLGLRLLIDGYCPELRDPTFEIKARRLARLVAATPAPPVTVVALGSSVTRSGFMAQAVEEQLGRQLGRRAAVVNLSGHGASVLTELVWMRRLLERGIRPDFVCVEVTPFQYGHPGPPEDIERFPDHLLSAADLEVVARYSDDPELRARWRHGQWCPAYFHRLTIVNYLAEWLIPVRERMPAWNDSLDERFWSARPPSPPAELQAILELMRAMARHRLRDYAPYRDALRPLDELLTLLEREGIPAAVVLAPEGPTVRAIYPTGTVGQLVAMIGDLSQRHGIPFVNAFEWLDEPMFIDSIHPNTVGAEVYSSRLTREVLLPALRSRSAGAP